MSWWSELDSSVQVSIVTSIVNIAVVTIGYVATYKSSIRAAAVSSNALMEQSKSQVSAQHIEKMAEFRLSWIEDLRASATSLYRDQFELYLLKRDLSSIQISKKLERARIRENRRELYLRIAETKNDMILRINPETKDQNEIDLLNLLKKSVSSDKVEALRLRRNISLTVNKVLRKEWKKASEGLGEYGSVK